MQEILDFFGSLPAGLATGIIGLATGIIVCVLGLAGKYLMDYRLQSRRLRLEEKKYGTEEDQARWRLRAEMRKEVYEAVGSTQANFVRAALELYERLSNFFENPDYTRPWLLPRSSLEQDGYYLREFVLRLFNFYVRGRITQDAINSLPVELMRERDDLLRLYTFVNLANSLITHTWLFRGVSDYPSNSEDHHLFTGTLAHLHEMGMRIWRENDEDLPRASFDEHYEASKQPLPTLRGMLTTMYADDNKLEEANHSAAYVMARLGALRAVLGAYLSLDHDWALTTMPEGRTIASEFEWDLKHADSLAPDQPELSHLVQRNLKELIARYRCDWLPVAETLSFPDNSKPNS